MAIFKCKMCGGSLEVTEGMTVCECEYCGTKQTIPKSHDDVLTNNFNRANNLRMKNEFDKAQELYEKIVSANPTEAEAYWGIVLCKYGIEYVEDPTTLKKIPTCHRTQYESVVSDVDYLSAIENADAGQKELFEKEAAEIDKLQKNILEIVHKEKPFDVFICYKETDENGKRTSDSVIANDIYYQLTQEGFKVFYAAITLEDKLGQEYEPYIFAALNSAKVMLVIGSNPEYFNAVWVKNEWSRYLKLMKSDRSKLLIPCYKDMDAYDLPEEFAHLQAQDMSKIGFINDVIRGMRKVLTKETSAPKAETKTVIKASSSNVENLIKRGNLALEDGKWNDAKGFFDQVLNEDVEEHRAYIGFLCAEYGIVNEQMLVQVNKDFTQSEYYQKACRFGGEEVNNRLYGYFLQGRYDHALNVLNNAKTVEDCVKAKEIFEWLGDFADAKQRVRESVDKGKGIIYKNIEVKLGSTKSEKIYNSATKEYESLGDYLDSKEKAVKCRELAKECRYNDAMMPLKIDSSKGSRKTIDDLKASIKVFEGLGDFKDSKEQIKNCETKIAEIEEHLQKVKEAEARARKKKKKITIIISAAAVVAVAAVIVFVTVFLPMIKYSNAKKMIDDKKYDEAIEAFEKMKDYKDSEELIKEAKFQKAVELGENSKYDNAIEILAEIDDYGDAHKAKSYVTGLKYLAKYEYNTAKSFFKIAGDFKDSSEKINYCEDEVYGKEYEKAIEYLNDKEYSIAITMFSGISEYKDSKELMEKAQKEYYDLAEKIVQEKEYDRALEIYTDLGDYADSGEKKNQIFEKKNKIIISKVVQLAKSGKFQDAFLASKDGSTSFEQIMKENGFSKQIEKFKNDIMLYQGTYYTTPTGSISAYERVSVDAKNWSISFLTYQFVYCFEKDPSYASGRGSLKFTNNGKYMTIQLSDGWGEYSSKKYNQVSNST